MGFSAGTSMGIYDPTTTGWTVSGNRVPDGRGYQRHGRRVLGSQQRHGRHHHRQPDCRLGAGFGADLRAVGRRPCRSATTRSPATATATVRQRRRRPSASSRRATPWSTTCSPARPAPGWWSRDSTVPTRHGHRPSTTGSRMNSFSGNGSNSIDLLKAGTDHQTGDGPTPNGTFGADAGNNGLDAPVIVWATPSSVAGTACGLVPRRVVPSCVRHGRWRLRRGARVPRLR